VRSAWLAVPLVLAAPPATSHAPALFSLPTLARIRLDAARDHLVVTEDINLPRGDWRTGDADLFVAFGAPGTPRAIDLRLFAAGEGGKDPPPDSPSEAVLVESAPRRPTSAYGFLGPPTMAGVVIHLREAALRRAFSPSGVARLRLRTLHDLPIEDARTGHEMLVRLGVRGGAPLAIGRLEMYSLEPDAWLLGAEAHLCGPEADPYPLAVTIHPPGTRPPPSPAPEAPLMSVRHASDDLCIRFWSQ
jgi:hypothetical protein